MNIFDGSDAEELLNVTLYTALSSKPSMTIPSLLYGLFYASSLVRSAPFGRCFCLSDPLTSTSCVLLAYSKNSTLKTAFLNSFSSGPTLVFPPKWWERRKKKEERRKKKEEIRKKKAAETRHKKQETSKKEERRQQKDENRKTIGEIKNNLCKRAL